MLFMKKHLGKIKIILNIFICILVVSFLICVCLQRFSNNEISFFNYRMFTVATGSMAPQYNVGDVLISKETAPEDVEIGDSVTYLGVYGSFTNKIVTHEVTSIAKDDNGDLIFHTKGIANLVEDPPVHEEQLYGVVVWRPIILSIVYKIVTTKFGLFFLVILPIFYIIGSEILYSMLEREEKRRNKLKEKEDDEDKSDEGDSKGIAEGKVDKTKKTAKKSTTKKEESENKNTTKKKDTSKKTTEKKKTVNKKEDVDNTSKVENNNEKKSTKKTTTTKKVVKKDK